MDQESLVKDCKVIEGTFKCARDELWYMHDAKRCNACYMKMHIITCLAEHGYYHRGDMERKKLANDLNEIEQRCIGCDTNCYLHIASRRELADNSFYHFKQLKRVRIVGGDWSGILHD